MLRRLLRRVCGERRVIGWCVACRCNVYDGEPNTLLDGDDVRVHDRCDTLKS